MNIFIAGSLIRALAYLWVSLAAFSLAQLYQDGYNFASKESAIINAIIGILNQLFIVFHNAPHFYYKCSQMEHKFVDYNYNISIERVYKCNFTIYNEVER